jgi:hypothetical protein
MALVPKKPTSSRNSSPSPVTRYARDVVVGRIVAGPHVRNACRRRCRGEKIDGPHVEVQIASGWQFLVADRFEYMREIVVVSEFDVASTKSSMDHRRLELDRRPNGGSSLLRDTAFAARFVVWNG